MASQVVLNGMVPPGYLAGFIDGEAYLGLARIPRRNGSYEYCIRLSIYNSYRPVLDEIQTTWGGTMSTVSRKLPVWKPAYALIWTNAAAAGVIRKVVPFLIVKSEQASALLEFDTRVKATNRSRDRLGHLLPLPITEVRERQAVYLKLKELNRRGPLSLRQGHERRFQRGGRPSAEYLAGFIDAEGSLMITRSRVAGARTFQYRPRIAVSNTKRAVLEAIQGTYGGILANQPARNPRWSPSFQLIWTETTVEGLLSKVVPYLRAKAPQARIISQFIEHRAARNWPNRRQGLPDDLAQTADSSEVFRQQIRKLNRRGLTNAS